MYVSYIEFYHFSALVHSQNYLINYNGYKNDHSMTYKFIKTILSQTGYFPLNFNATKDLEMVTSKPESARSLCCLPSSAFPVTNTGTDFALGSLIRCFLSASKDVFRDRENFPSNIKLRRSSV